MTKLSRYCIIAGILAVTTEPSARAAKALLDLLTPPPVPTNLQVPAGNILFQKGHAQGTQNYVCLPSAGGFSWTFLSPQATLFLTFNVAGGEIRQQMMTHFLSPNPEENGTPRATWQSSLDSSAVWARATQSSTDPNFVAPGAIPWLLLQEAGTQPGPIGGDFLAYTTYVQRLSTSGGVAPSTGCSQPENVGATVLVPYTADYFFFKASMVLSQADTNSTRSLRVAPLASAATPSSSTGWFWRLTQNVGYPNALAPAASQPAKAAKPISSGFNAKTSMPIR